MLKARQQKQGTKILKSAFNTSVLAHIGIDHRDNKPHELSRGERLEKWQYEQRNAAAGLEIQKRIAKLQNQVDK
ncbi:hypothetical protein [Agarivorans sp. B2Z047]|uniref:hypothetical protein n=1 Tax=Agarivorans sp. B2Z047 TaxID=2652721 RepID=UPI0018844171|nr:hypothetical protein [Agarivorans sp. B2Z047]UQN43710.1 hypothetical protein LQZ07_04360 [Agarivorans sp. B2Z047]